MSLELKSSDKLVDPGEMARTLNYFANLIDPKAKQNQEKKQGIENLSRLHEQLSDKKVQSSFDSLEAINKPQKNPTMREHLPVVGYALASGFHIVAAFIKAIGFLPKKMEDFIDKFSLRASKFVNLANYTYKGVEALFQKRAWDGIGRLAYSAIIPWMDLEDVFLASGVSSGITMYEQGQRHKVKEPKSLWSNFLDNFKAFKLMVQEIFQSGFGRNRKIFVPEKREKGHTMFFSANGNFIGALLGLIAGRGKSPLKKVASLVRNAGGVACDWAKLIHPDKDNQRSGRLYFAVSVLDVIQTLSNNNFLSRVLSHLSLALNNVANYYYVKTTQTTTDKTFVDYGSPAMQLAA